MTRLLSGLVVVVLSGAIGSAQSGYRGLEPGRSTRADADRVLGTATTPPTGSLVEYPSSRQGERIFVTLGDSGVLERVVLVYANNLDRAGALTAAGLAATTALGTVVNERGRLEEFFRGSHAIFTYAGEAATSGVNRITFQERSVFELAASKAQPAKPDVPPTDRPTRPGAAAGPPPPAKARARDVHAIHEDLGQLLAGTYVVDDSDWLSEIVVTWSAGRLHARLPMWSAALYSVRRIMVTVAGEPDDEQWMFSADGDEKVFFQFSVSRDRNRPVRVSFIDDRREQMLVEDGVKRVR